MISGLSMSALPTKEAKAEWQAAWDKVASVQPKHLKPFTLCPKPRPALVQRQISGGGFLPLHLHHLYAVVILRPAPSQDLVPLNPKPQILDRSRSTHSTKPRSRPSCLLNATVPSPRMGSKNFARECQRLRGDDSPFLAPPPPRIQLQERTAKAKPLPRLPPLFLLFGRAWGSASSSQPHSIPLIPPENFV